MRKALVLATKVIARPVADQRGAALITAMVLMMAMLVLTLALLSTGTDEVNIATNHYRSTQALFLAEAGLEVAYTLLRNNSGMVSGASDALTTLALPTSAQLSTVGTYTVQYQKAAETNSLLVISTGRDATGAQQTLRTLMTRQFRGPDALLVGGDLKLDQHAQFLGDCGAIHANGNVDSNLHYHADGHGGRVTQSLTSSGTMANDHPEVVSGLVAGGRPKQEIPVINPLAFLDLAKSDIQAGRLNASEVFQFMDDGRVLNGNDTLLVTLKNDQKFNSWKYKAGDKKWELNSGDGVTDGTYYFEGAAKVGGDFKAVTMWTVTILAAKKVEITGSPKMTQHLSDALVVAGTDLIINAGSTSTIGTEDDDLDPTDDMVGSGLIAAHEQVLIKGNSRITGQVIAENAASTDDSVKANSVQDSARITYNCGGFRSPLTATLRMGTWGL